MYPSTLASLTDPLASDRLNSPSHSAIETAQNTNIEAIENFVGIEGASSIVGTLIYDVRSPASDGGGHVQTAVKGGTGQTTFTKGDILAAQSASVLGKLTVGLDGQLLASNSSVASGINWINPTNNKIATSGSVITILSTTEASIISTTISGSTLGINNAIRSNVFVQSWTPNAGTSVLAAFHYGGMRVASVMLTSQADGEGSVVGTFRHTMIANNSATLQKHFLEARMIGRNAIGGTNTTDNIFFQQGTTSAPSIISVNALVNNTSSINSSANQTYGMTIKMTGTVTRDLSTGGYVIEKIN